MVLSSVIKTDSAKCLISKPEKNELGVELLDDKGKRQWIDEGDVVQGIVLLRKGEDSLPALVDVEALVKELNETPGRLLPGVKIVPYYDRTGLIHTTTETVRENLFHGMALVTIVLLMFLGNVRTALIVAINVPLAVLVAFSALYLRGESANLLSIVPSTSDTCRFVGHHGRERLSTLDSWNEC